MSYRYHDRILWGLIFISIGLLFLLKNLGYLTGGIGKWWPIILVIVGIRLFFCSASPKREGHPPKREETDSQ